jgi:nickel/cobalt transporter (NicO) family protein
VNRIRPGLIGAVLGLFVSLLAVAAASAHPLGNYTVNRAVIVRVYSRAVLVRYLIDMAEIPAFATLQQMDTDGDRSASAPERGAWAEAACADANLAMDLRLDGGSAALVPGRNPVLAFPPGAGGLETLRLECAFRTAIGHLADGDHALSVTDTTDDGHIGWREVVVTVGPGARLLESDALERSPSSELTEYPADRLESPPDVRSATARFRVEATAEGEAAIPAPPAGPRSTAADPLAALLSAEPDTLVALLAFLIAAGLGAAHALSPGHGKTLVAAYLIGTRGTVRQAAGLGLTVAATHTAGVFILAAVTLAAGEFLVPERVIAWLSLLSGALVAILGARLVLRAILGVRRHTHEHEHPEADRHDHPHPHAHPAQKPRLSAWSLVALGLAGGMVPSASALIVLLAAISTGRLLFGLGLIVAFGLGMAMVLGGLAAVTTFVRGVRIGPGWGGLQTLAARAGRLVPVASGTGVLVIGLAVAIGSVGRLG